MYANPSLLQILLFSTLPHLTRADGVATIYLAPGYGKLPDCALQCYGYDPSGGISAAGGYLLANVLGCPQLPLKNDCFCSSDYQFVASTYLSSCAVAKCSKLPKPKTIAQSAFDVYHDYCEGNGYVKADGKFKPTDGKTPATNSATVTSSTSSPTAASNQQPASSDGGDEKKLGTGEIVGIVLGVLGFIVAVITLVINWRSLKTMVQHKKPIPHPDNPYERYEHEHEMTTQRRW